VSARTAMAGATRDRIVDTALRLFSERGTSAASMRELADASGITVQGLYYHFASKAELISAVYRARGLGAGLEPGLPDPSLDAALVRDRIVEQARREFARLVADEEFLRLMQRESALGDEDAREVGHALEGAWRDRWRSVLAGASDVHAGADLAAAADCIPTFLWGLFVEYLNHGDPTVVRRIDAFAALVAPALTGGPS
jgi:AcrR family transcriptional regulator